jgi:hypothetical protein
LPLVAAWLGWATPAAVAAAAHNKKDKANLTMPGATRDLRHATRTPLHPRSIREGQRRGKGRMLRAGGLEVDRKSLP